MLEINMDRKEISRNSPGGKISCKLENENRSFPECREVLEALKSISDPERIAGTARYAINTEGTLEVSMPRLRQTAKKLGKNHTLALELWASGIHEARILACLVGDSALVLEE
jgi:3-methyladenine DNA glycosylase AlkD